MMANFEEEFLRSVPTRPLIWLRFIDDIFLIWENGRTSLDHFIEDLNRRHPTVKFLSTVSNRSVDFLDITILKGDRFLETGILDFSPHYKPTNRFQYLQYNSAHPRSTFRGIVKGELLRILRASPDESTYKTNQRMILAKFSNRGYPRRVLSWATQQVQFCSRKWALTQDSTPRPPFTMTTSQRQPSYMC